MEARNEQPDQVVCGSPRGNHGRGVLEQQQPKSVSTATDGHAPAPTSTSNGRHRRQPLGVPCDRHRRPRRSLVQRVGHQGLLDAKTADANITVQSLQSTAATDYVPNITAFIQKKCGIIVTVGFLMGDATQAAAKANPTQSSPLSTTANSTRPRGREGADLQPPPRPVFSVATWPQGCPRVDRRHLWWQNCLP